jgi:ketosteroid isomerase-like protein
MIRTSIAALFLSSVCATSAFADPKAEMMAADKAFSDMSVAKGAHAAFLAYMADDVLEYDGAHPPLVGKAAVAAYYAEQDKKNPSAPPQKLEWTPISADASADGTLGYTRGTWDLTGKKKDGSTLALKGYYVTEWRKQADGSYKFVLDIGGSF